MSGEKPKLSRRDLLQGKLWKLLRPRFFQPLVMRYPRTRGDVIAGTRDVIAGTRDDADPVVENEPKPAIRNIKGIAIQSVPTTRFASSQRVPTVPVFRPPGAIAEVSFLAGCTRCGECITACPYQAIKNAPDRLGPIAGTPIIVADDQACVMCKDYPCITACQPRVLTATIPVVMGTAKVTEHLCIAHHGTTCTVCSERCPVENAIMVIGGKPTVDEERCTGCGVCRYVCPAPENAILLMPIFSRPAAPPLG